MDLVLFCCVVLCLLLFVISKRSFGGSLEVWNGVLYIEGVFCLRIWYLRVYLKSL